jgi:hypothetical protein
MQSKLTIVDKTWLIRTTAMYYQYVEHMHTHTYNIAANISLIIINLER